MRSRSRIVTRVGNANTATVRLAVVAVAASLILAGVAHAQTSPLSGTIVSANAHVLVVHGRDGRDVSVNLPDDVPVGALQNRTLADIKPGEFVGSAAMEGTDGKLHAQEVHIFPENMRGTGEGHRPMEQPGQTMTNAVVAEVAGAAEGQTLKLKYQGGEKEIDVAPGTRIVALIPGDRSLLVPGAAVLVFFGKPGADGLVARYVQAEKDGVRPLR